jgi:hypothetical protein
LGSNGHSKRGYESLAGQSLLLVEG